LEARFPWLVDQAFVEPVGVAGEDVVSRVGGEELVELTALLGVLDVDPGPAFEGVDVLVGHGGVPGEVHEFGPAVGTAGSVMLDGSHLARGQRSSVTIFAGVSSQMV
jgi:hypothetical protein